MPARWHQRRNAGYQLRRCEVQLVDLGATLVRARLAVLFGAAVGQGGVHKQRVGGRSSSTAATGRRCRLLRYTHWHRPKTRCAGRPACLWRHNSPAGPGRLRRAGCVSEICLYLGHSGLIGSTGWVEDDDQRRGLGIGVARHFLKHPINHTDLTTKLRRRLTITQRACYAAGKVTMAIKAEPNQCIKTARVLDGAV